MYISVISKHMLRIIFMIIPYEIATEHRGNKPFPGWTFTKIANGIWCH